MMKPSLTTFIESLQTGTNGAVDYTKPSNGSVIANFEGTLNASTLTCNVINSGMRIGTSWFVQDLTPDVVQAISDDFHPELFLISGDQRPNLDPGRTYRNRLTIVNMTAQLDGVTIYCGLGQSALSELANFLLRVYRKSNLANIQPTLSDSKSGYI